MSLEASSIASDEPVRCRGFLARVIRRLVPTLEAGRLHIVLPGGDHVDLCGWCDGPTASVVVHRWRALGRILLAGEAGFSDGYIAGDWSTSDLLGVLDFFLRNQVAFSRAANSWGVRALDRLRHRGNANTKSGSRRNIAAHYDLGNDFYRCWLDSGMNYSSAIYVGDQTLEVAQQAKLDRVAESLGLAGDQTVLEIGCGWGAMAEHLVRKSGASVTAVTLSEAQLDFARNRLAPEIEARRAAVYIQDYRDVSGSFDRIVSIEMFEACGQRYLPLYFEKIATCLAKGGAAVLQIITIDPARFDVYCNRPDFIQRHIFPGGMLPTVQIVEREAAKARLKVICRESFGLSYARTLHEWRSRFLQSWKNIEELGFDLNFKRMWEYYLAYCEIGFRRQTVDVNIFKLVHRGA